MSAQYQLPREVLEQIAKDIADAKPATPALLVQLADSSRQVREHDHSAQREDWFCMNQTSWAGGRIATVLRRVLDSDAEIQQLRSRVAELESQRSRYRIAWRRARTRAVSAGGAADRYAARSRQQQEAAQDLLEALLTVQMERDELKKQAGKDTADGGESTRAAEPAELTVFRAQHDTLPMGLYTTAAAARAHCEAEVRREHDESTKVSLWWREDDSADWAEAGEAELMEHVTPQGVDRGRTWRTGYVVTPLTVASAYDEGEDE